MKYRLQLPGVVRAGVERVARPQRGDREGSGPQYLRSSGGPRHVLAPGKYFFGCFYQCFGPGPGAVLTPGSGRGKNQDPDQG
jgi:hypothetical protein